MRRSRGVALVLPALLFFFIPGLLAQGQFGGITGTITDSSGAVIPGATVTITDMNTNRRVVVTSTSDGTYLARSLSPGTYSITVAKHGFKTVTQSPIIVNTATTSTVNMVLPVGAVTQHVTVTASLVHVQTTNAEIGTNVSTKEMLDLPISVGGAATIGASGRRQIQNFVFLTPGTQGNQWEMSIDGAPGFSQDILVDGADMQNIGAPGFIAADSPPYEAVSQFKLQNTLYPAMYGGGFGVENFTLRSGTNHFHGDLFEFLRNNDLDAAGFFGNSSPLPPLQQNEFGGTLGGPLILPHIFNGLKSKHNTYFFFSASYFRLRGGLPTSNLVTIPTLLERNGDFTDYPYPIYDPATTQPDGQGGYTRQQVSCNGALNVICPDRISAVAQRWLALLPSTELPGFFNNYVDKSNQPTNEQDYSFKIDTQINEKQHLSGAFWIDDASTVINGALPGALNPGFRKTPTFGGGIRVNWTDSLSSNMLNNVAFGYTPVSPTWSHWLLDPRLGNQVLKIPGIPSDAHGYPSFTFTNGYVDTGNAGNSGRDPQFFQNWDLRDDATWVTGRNQVQFGGEYRHRAMTVGDFTNVAGTFNFSNLNTSLPDSPNFSSWGNPIASLELGQVFSANRSVPPPIQHFYDDFIALYAQDTIKVKQNVTLSLGLRYELPLYAKESHNTVSFLSLFLPNPEAGNIPGALQFLGNGNPLRGNTGSIFGAYHVAFSPRIGLTYALNSKTVVRTGYGIFRIYPNYGRLNETSLWTNGYGYSPSVTSTNSGVTPAFNLDQGFPPSNITLPDLNPSLLNGQTAAWVNGSANVPAFMQAWTFDIQRYLPFNMMADVAYVGSHTTGLWTGLENIDQVNPKYLSLGQTLFADINSPEAAAAGITAPYPGFTGSVAQALRPFPQYTGIYDMFQPTGDNRYDSLQVRVQKPFSNGLTLLLSYTLSKNIGKYGGDTFGDPFGGGGFTSLNTFNQAAEKSLIGIDQTHVVNLAWTYELPIGRGKRFFGSAGPVLNQLVGGWQVNGIQTYASGTPVSVGGGPVLPIFGGGNRPNELIGVSPRSNVSMSNFNPATDRYLNASAFSQPAPFTFGDAPRTLPNVRAPFYYDEDFSIFKRFYLWRESRYLEFRADAFDVFNRVVFGGPASDFNNLNTFGIIGYQANTPRVIQFAMKLIF